MATVGMEYARDLAVCSRYPLGARPSNGAARLDNDIEASGTLALLVRGVLLRMDEAAP